MDLKHMQATIEAAWEKRDTISPSTQGDVRGAVEDALRALDGGKTRVAEKHGSGWVVNQWLKKAVLLSFRLSDSAVQGGGPGKSTWYDKVPSKFEGWGDNAFRAAGFRLAVASSADLVKIHANLEKIGLPPNWWDAVVSAEDVVHKKPAPDIFLAAARKLHCPPARCVVIEDAINGVQAALAAKMRCVAVAQTFPADRLREATLVRARLADVTLADLEPPGELG